MKDREKLEKIKKEVVKKSDPNAPKKDRSTKRNKFPLK